MTYYTTQLYAVNYCILRVYIYYRTIEPHINKSTPFKAFILCPQNVEDEIHKP